MKVTTAIFATAAILFGASVANASPVVLNFAGLNGTAEEAPLNYYAGGFGSDGSGPGPNYGITFSSNAITCTGAPTPGSCNTAEIPGGPGANVLYYLTGAAATMDVPGGFKTGFSFYYSAVFDPGSITVWSGLDGTGSLLATLGLPLTPIDGNSGCFSESFCPYEEIGVAFAGTAESVDFGGDENEVGFADITLGSTKAGVVPEPFTLSLFGAGLAGVIGMRRRKKAAQA